MSAQHYSAVFNAVVPRLNPNQYNQFEVNFRSSIFRYQLRAQFLLQIVTQITTYVTILIQFEISMKRERVRVDALSFSRRNHRRKFPPPFMREITK